MDLASQALLECLAWLNAAAWQIPIRRDAVDIVAADQNHLTALGEADAVCLIDVIELGPKGRVEPRSGPRSGLHVVLDEPGIWFPGPVEQPSVPETSSHQICQPRIKSDFAATSRWRVPTATGDNDRVAQHACAALGLPVEGIMTGVELQAIDDKELAQRLPSTTIFARVTPEQKSRIIRLQRCLGVDVAFLGDGVNDAVALHQADVGISVDSASDVAKEAAQVVLLEMTSSPRPSTRCSAARAWRSSGYRCGPRGKFVR